MASTSNIASGTRITGRITADGDLEILGHVEGSIVVGGALTIGEQATLKCDLQGGAIEISGAVAGDVNADQSILLQPGARVQGDLKAPNVGIRPGALVRGHVTAGGQAAAAPAEAARHHDRTTEPKAEAQQAAAGKPASAARAAQRRDRAESAPAPAMPKSAGKGKKRSATKRTKAAQAPEPVVPALKKQSAKTKAKRRRTR